MDEELVKVGDPVRIYGTVLLNCTTVDPTTLEITITPPTGGPYSYEWPTDPEVVRDDTGQFHFDLLITQAGLWSWHWEADGAFTVTGDGEIDVADPATVETRKASDSTAVPFVDWTIRNTGGEVVDQGQTDASGNSASALPDGAWLLEAAKLGWVFAPTRIDVTGAGPHTLTILGSERVAEWLLVSDLESCIGRDEVDRLFQDRNSGVRDPVLVDKIIREAEALAASKLLRSWSRESIAILMANDPGARNFAAWIACELATERRGEFIAEDGKGRYWAQYERAIAHFDAVSKSKDHSLGEDYAGKGANAGGAARPVKTSPQASRHVFAPEGDGRGHGGF